MHVKQKHQRLDKLKKVRVRQHLLPWLHKLGFFKKFSRQHDKSFYRHVINLVSKELPKKTYKKGYTMPIFKKKNFCTLILFHKKI